MRVQRPQPTTDQPRNHELIVTRQSFDQQRNRKRVHFRCQVKGCCRGLIDAAPANAANAIMSLLQQQHAEEWPPDVFLPRGRQASSWSPNTRA